MNSSDWIDADTACALLGVKPQTLYAYVSRRQLRAQADRLDARRSLYARADVEALVRANHRPRARAEVAEAAIRWGDPVLPTAISELGDGTLWLRGRALADCARAMTLEEVAAHLCDVPDLACPPAPAPAGGGTPLGRALNVLAAAAAEAPPMQGRARAAIAAEGGQLLARVAAALSGHGGAARIHQRLAAGWGLDVRGADDIRRALVLMAEHELNPSTFAVRVTASTGASLPAALLSGMATLAGPRHGGVALTARRALRASEAGETEAFLVAPEGAEPYDFGFGHPLYPEGDPRARLLLDRLPAGHPVQAAVARLAARLGLHPNIDVALAALSEAHCLPDDAAFTLFATGRLAGWIAHAIEQVESGAIIRPRARFARHP